jgi:hypothetical protein
MNKERYNQIIDDAYKNYCKKADEGTFSRKWLKLKESFDGFFTNEEYSLYTKEEFINKCKTDPEFSEKWGLKIEEREILKQIDQTNPMLKGSTTLVPTKQITLTYNNETIESYE